MHDGVNVDGDPDTTVDDTIDVTISVTNVDEAPVLSGLETVSYAENGTGSVATYTAVRHGERGPRLDPFRGRRRRLLRSLNRENTRLIPSEKPVLRKFQRFSTSARYRMSRYCTEQRLYIVPRCGYACSNSTYTDFLRENHVCVRTEL